MTFNTRGIGPSWYIGTEVGGLGFRVAIVWLLGHSDRSKELPASRCKCLLGSVTVSTYHFKR